MLPKKEKWGSPTLSFFFFLMQKNIPSGVRKSSLPVRVIRWTAVQVISFVLAVLILGIGYAAVTWTNISSGSGAAGQPVTQTLIQGIINNMNDLNNRLTGINPSGTAINVSKIQISTLYQKTQTVGLNGGSVTATCNTGDLLYRIQTMACPTSLIGGLEQISSSSNSATLYCDSGDNATYDGGTLVILCMSGI
ncbi:MAG: hypothetical protein PHY14_00350 [Candidatus Gracilibacteria bacterium]|nr:hypothetical protein [Candidatus Gracilibacteria bacterium]